MSKAKVLWVVVPAVVLIGAGVAGAAGYKHYRGHHGMERVVERITETLDLDADQQQKLEAVREAFDQGRRQMHQSRAGAMNELIEEVRKPQMDRSMVMSLIERRKAAMESMLPQVVDPIIEFHKSLNDEQRAKIVNLLETFRDWGPGHFRHG